MPPWHDAGGEASCASCSWCREGMQKAPRSPVGEDRRGLGRCVSSSSKTGDMHVTLASGERKKKLVKRRDAGLNPRRGAPEKGSHTGSYQGNHHSPNPRDGWRWKAAASFGVWDVLCFCRRWGERVGVQLGRAESAVELGRAGQETSVEMTRE